MTVHIKKRHLYKIRYPCEICPNKSWRTLFQLQRHVKVFHNNIREFKCEWWVNLMSAVNFTYSKLLLLKVRKRVWREKQARVSRSNSHRWAAIQVHVFWMFARFHASNRSSTPCLGSHGRAAVQGKFWFVRKSIKFKNFFAFQCQNQTCLKGFMKKSELTAHESRCHPVVRPSMPMPFQYQMM